MAAPALRGVGAYKRWKARALMTLPLVLVAVLSCAPPTPPAEEMVKAQAQTSLAPFKGALKSELTAALATGPEVAIDVCGLRAPALAAQHSVGGVRVGRSSPKLRSAANAAPPWLVPVMAELASAPSGTSASRVTMLPSGRWGYAEAIWMQPACLTCHGEAIAAPIDAELRKRYPSDAARGYRVGDFRGVFFAELERTALAPRP